MWNLKAFVVLIGTLWISGAAESFTIPDETETEILSQALVKIAKEIIAPINKTVNTCNGAGNRLNNLSKYLMKDLNNSMTVTNELRPNIGIVYDYQNQHMKASLVICDEWNIAEDELNHVEFVLPAKMGYITYVTTEAAERYIAEINNMEIRIFFKTLLLVNDGEFVDLKVAAYISESSCEKAHLRTINRFSKRTRQWQEPSFDLVKLRSNNHECPIKILPFAHSPEIIGPGNILLGTDSYSNLSGYFITMTNELSRRLNFSIQDKMDSTSISDIDLMLTGFSTEQSSILNLTFNLISIYREIIVVVPLGDFYSGFEKLFLPFDDATWILIAMTFAIGLMTILIVTQLSLTIRNFVIGRDVTAPTVNLFAAFFGLGQTQLPGRNFGRFLLMLYIIWCLIIRTGYQGVLYDLLKGDGSKPQNLQLDDFINNNATVHMNIFCDYSLIEQRTQFKR